MNEENNTDLSITRPLSEIIKYGQLQRLHNVIDCFQDYHKNKAQNSNHIKTSTAYIYSRILSLFFTLQPMLKRTLPDKEYIQLLELIKDRNNYDKLETAFFILNEILDAKKVTRIDLISEGNKIDVGVDNEEMNL